MMGVPISQHQSFPLDVVEDDVDVGLVGWRESAGGVWRAVGVVDFDWSAVDCCGDSLQLEVRVGVEGRVDWRKFDGRVDEKGQSTAITPVWTVAPQNRITRNLRILGAEFQFGFLDSSNLHIVFVEIFR